jgi:outer membrane protein insertion porin family
MAKTRIEELYRERGYPRTQVQIREGNEASDSQVVFLVHEDQQQRIWKVDFEGNTVASAARLRSMVKAKPGILKVIGGIAEKKKIDQDIVRLESYYKSLGYFNVQIGREINESNDGRWLTIRFIINEGPRYKIREVRFVGNERYASTDLVKLLQLKPGAEGQPEFNSARMTEDVTALRDLYGANGFVYADVQAEPRFLEEPGYLDMVYRISEGEQYRVGQINVNYNGGNGVTRREVILNRLSLRPGDLIDARKLRNDEIRLGSARIFATGQEAGGSPPRIVVRPPEKGSEFNRIARKYGGGGESPPAGSDTKRY